MKSIEIKEKDLRQWNKNLETEEGSCLMETWKRRGEPEKKAVTETREGKYFSKEENRQQCWKRVAGKGGWGWRLLQKHNFIVVQGAEDWFEKTQTKNSTEKLLTNMA